MELVDVWPLFGLRLFSPRLELRIVRDDDLPGLLEAAIAGIHDPEVMPFAAPWTDAESDKLRRGFAQHHWAQRVSVRRGTWSIIFAVLADGVPIGVQNVSTTEFEARRTIDSGSWLTRAHQGRGLGTEMRAAMLLFAFDHLGAEVAESGAAVWNAASLGVSRKLGYRENGIARIVSRPGEVTEEQRLRLLREDFVRPTWTLRVEGFDAARGELIAD
jgi:RimJ/RimL family protein N-acetyltransferase